MENNGVNLAAKTGSQHKNEHGRISIMSPGDNARSKLYVEIGDRSFIEFMSTKEAGFLDSIFPPGVKVFYILLQLCETISKAFGLGSIAFYKLHRHIQSWPLVENFGANAFTCM